MRMVIAIVAFLLAAGTACGGGNGDETASPSAIEPAAQERAEAMVLQLSDFPTGWRGSAPEEADREGFRKCVGTDLSGFTKIGDASSQDFAKGDSTSASSEAIVYKDEQQAIDAFSEISDGLNSADAEDCFQNIVEENVRNQSTGNDQFRIGEVDVGQLNLTQPGVEDFSAWQVVIPVEITSGVGEGFAPNVYIEFVGLRQGNAVASVSTQDSFTEFDTDLRDKLIQTVAQRMTESSGG